MNADIRVSTSFRGHRKRKKLNAILGYDATGRLLDLWIGAAIARPDGRLTGWDRFDIGIESGMDSCTESEIDRYVSALISVGFLEEESCGLFILHDWLEHNMYASFSEKRSEKGVFNNLKRWHPDIAEKLKNEGKTSITKEEYKKLVSEKEQLSLQESCTDPNPNPPSPNPNPNPNPNPKDNIISSKSKRFVPPTIDEVREYCAERKNTVDPELFVDHYQAKGWMLSTGKMKDWRASVRTWEKNGHDRNRGQPKIKAPVQSFANKDYGEGGLL